MKCRDCKYCYNNETMRDLYICVNGNAENFGQFTSLLCEDDCPDGEEEFIYPEISDDDPFEILGAASEEDLKNIEKLIKCGSEIPNNIRFGSFSGSQDNDSGWDGE